MNKKDLVERLNTIANKASDMEDSAQTLYNELRALRVMLEDLPDEPDEIEDGDSTS